MERSYKTCQSCGMPVKKVEQRGSNRDGSPNLMYCHHCFEDGHFTARNITVQEMKEKVKDKLKEFGVPRFMTGLFTRKLHKLERWREHPLAID